MIPYLSIVIPAYNETASIGPTLEAIVRYCAANAVAVEILVVDDGSTDGTAELVGQAVERHPQIRLLRSDHQGKGGAVKQGILAATGRYVLFLDADYSTRLEEWEKLRPWLDQGYGAVIGSRKMAGADIQRHQSSLRRLLGKGFTWLTNLMLSTRVTDITCGFKAFRADVAKAVFARQRLAGWGFDAETLFLLRRFGVRLKEVPVIWTNDATSNVRLWKDVGRSFAELIAIRRHAWLGHYGRPPARTGGASCASS